MNIIDHGLDFTPLTKRVHTVAIVLHHSDTGDKTTVESIHQHHKNTNGWSGIGYNFVIYKDGSIHKGRGWEYVGAHAGTNNGYNAKSIGICFIGQYNSVDTTMPDAQYNAGVWLIAAAKERYQTIREVVAHKDVSATTCPGRHFPLKEMLSGVYRNTEDSEVRYQTLDEIPQWGKPTVEKLLTNGILRGTDEGLNLSEDMLRLLVIHDRAGLYKTEDA